MLGSAPRRPIAACHIPAQSSWWLERALRAQLAVALKGSARFAALAVPFDGPGRRGSYGYPWPIWPVGVGYHRIWLLPVNSRSHGQKIKGKRPLFWRPSQAVFFFCHFSLKPMNRVCTKNNKGAMHTCSVVDRWGFVRTARCWLLAEESRRLRPRTMLPRASPGGVAGIGFPPPFAGQVVVR